MNILDKLEIYLNKELIELIINTIYQEYLENVKQKREKNLIYKIRYMMNHRYSNVYLSNNIN